jgi:hypothetical protein
MTTLIVIGALLLLALIISQAYIFYRLNVGPRQLPNPNEYSATLFDWKVGGLLIVALLFVGASFISPIIFTRTAATEDFNFQNTGEIGDTIGGLMNPFIALAGVIVTGLAFYIQYKANQQQRELFIKGQKDAKEDLQKQIDHQSHQLKIQQFESRFYEMLKLHRENITEMQVSGYDFVEAQKSKDDTKLITMEKIDKPTQGRKIFVTMKAELESILSIYRLDNKLDKDGFEKCYYVFFFGIEDFEKRYKEEEKFIDHLKSARKQHEYPDLTMITKNDQRKKYNGVELHFNYKPFSGHASRLGHYFRHLYLAVKSVANSKIITKYKERMHYLRLLRAQLSNHEQILLFYNWLGEFGYDCEKKKNVFFTEYCMIHNLWHNQLFDDNFINEQVDYLRTKEVKLRKGKMFEID